MKLAKQRQWLLIVIIVLVLLTAGAIGWLFRYQSKPGGPVNNFQECVNAGGVMTMTYPEQCYIYEKVYHNPNQHLNADGTGTN